MNILLIALDTQRRDHLSCYGYPRKTSPTLDRLAAEGALFENCVTNTAHTMPTFTTMMTGQDCSGHGIVGTLYSHPNEPDQRLDDTTPILAEIMRDNGYVTAAFDNLADFGCHPSWFVRGYQWYVNTWAPAWGHPCQVTADEINARLLPWLRTYGDDQQWFLFVHYWDAHQPYNQPEPYRSIHAGGPQPEPVEISGREYVPTWGWADRLDEASRGKIDLYDGELSYVDNAIAQVVGVLERLDVYDETAIIVTADHGEDMEEHNAPFEHREPYETTVGIPLIFKPATGVRGKDEALSDRCRVTPCTRVAGIVGNIDLMPSILDTAGIEAPETVEGKSWLPMVRGEAESIHDCLFLTGGAIKEHGTWKSPELAVRTDRYKYIRRGTAHYDEGQTHLDNACLCAPPWRGEPGHTGQDRIDYFNGLSRRELYDLQSDSHEQVNLVEALPEAAEGLDARLREFASRQPERLVVE